MCLVFRGDKITTSLDKKQQSGENYIYIYIFLSKKKHNK